MEILIDVVWQRLFDAQDVRKRILRDFGVTDAPSNPAMFRTSVLGQLDQKAVADPLDQDLDNHKVFRAATRAIASNSRSWITFLRLEPRLTEMLCGYSPTETWAAYQRGSLSIDAIKTCLPGITSTKDARAILSWSKLLVTNPDFFQDVKQLCRQLQSQYEDSFGTPLPQAYLPLVLVGVLAAPHPRRGGDTIRQLRQQTIVAEPKLPGMAYILASEFLRNLHFSAFKPDRHIQRLFDLWFGNAVLRADADVAQLQGFLGRQNAAIRTYLRYAIIGTSATPPSVTISSADSAVWLLGAYLERKNQESTHRYAQLTPGGSIL